MLAPAKLLIVDDHPIVRQGLVDLFNRQPDLAVCAEAEGVEEALELIRKGNFDLVLLDLALRGRSGLELVKQLQAERETLPVLILSMYDELFYAERAMRAGARGYVMKQEAIDQIILAIRRVLNGEVFVSDAVANKMLNHYINGKAAGSDSSIDQLSDRELEVFQLIGQGYGTRQIAELLHLSIKTVESYRANIKQKLHLRNGAELVQQAVHWLQMVALS